MTPHKLSSFAAVLCFTFVPFMHAQESPAERVAEIQAALADAALDGWLFYDFRHSDPLAYRILGLGSEGITTRRWFCYVPAHGAARALVSAVEAERLTELGIETIVYRSAD